MVKTMKKAIIYIHGKGGNAEEAAHFQPLFPDCDVLGFDYRAETPWDAKREFSAYIECVRRDHGAVSVIANSIGAFFLMQIPDSAGILRAYFISPVVDMEKLILHLMAQANVTEEDLREKKEIRTEFGEVLSWGYLCYVREAPIVWNVPTKILYGECDALTDYSDMSAFAERTGASLDVMKGGEHWFHTKEQMEYLDHWIIG